MLAAVYNCREILMGPPLQVSNKCVKFIRMHIKPKLKLKQVVTLEIELLKHTKRKQRQFLYIHFS